jgi:hypothetical protein
MRRTALCVALLVGAIAGAAGAALPRNGVLVPGRSLGGIRLGETAAQVRAALGPRYGLCRGCTRTTWYYTYGPFTRRGLAVELSRGRVSALWTIWQPAGWTGPRALRMGTVDGQVSALAAGPLIPIVCSSYEALTKATATTQTVYYIVDRKLWGFGLMRPHVSPCR